MMVLANNKDKDIGSFSGMSSQWYQPILEPFLHSTYNISGFKVILNICTGYFKNILDSAGLVFFNI